jgi:predicted TIM-barrel fold metal-dependent hydrolase
MTVVVLITLLVVLHLFWHGARKTDLSLLSRKEIVDMHLHVAGVGAGNSGCHVSDRLRRNWRYKIYLRAFGVSESDLQRYGDAIVFKKISERIDRSKSVKAAVVLALDGVIDKQGRLDLGKTETYVPNEFVAQETAKYPNLLFGASVNPYRPDALQRLEQVAEQGAVLIKWLPAIQHIDPADERLIPFYKKMSELELPLLTHAGGERSFTTAETKLGDPQKLHLPLSHGVTVIAAHAATTGKSDGEDNMLRLLRMFSEHANLYTDISSLTQANKLRFLPKLIKHNVDSRLVYGTDFPLINTPLVSAWYYFFNLSIKQMWQIGREPCCWDRDVLLKSALSVPGHVFTTWDRLSPGLKGGAECAQPEHPVSAKVV